MCSQNLTPDAAELCAVGSGGIFCLVDEGNAFSQVEICGSFVLNTFYLDKRGVLVLIAKSTSVSHDNSTNIKAVVKGKYSLKRAVE